MSGPTGRVAIVTARGVADQRPGQSVREVARLLCHGGDGAPRSLRKSIVWSHPGKRHGMTRFLTPP